MEGHFGGLTDLFVLAAECQTGAYLTDKGGFFRQNAPRGIIVFATQWRPDAVLAIYLHDFSRLEVGWQANWVQASVDVRVDEEGFRMEFPNGAQIAAKRATYQIINLDSLGLANRPDPVRGEDGVWKVAPA